MVGFGFWWVVEEEVGGLFDGRVGVGTLDSMREFISQMLP